MGLKLPEGAEAAFRIETLDAFGNRFAINVYGRGRRGWFVATLRFHGRALESGIQRLRKGEWRTLLHLIDRCGFWSLPEDGAHLADLNFESTNGEWLTVTGCDAERQHRVHRFVDREPGLDALWSFAHRVSDFFVPHPVAGFCLRDGDAEPTEAPEPDGPFDQ